MSAVLVVLAAALLAAPTAVGRARLRALDGPAVRRRPWRSTSALGTAGLVGVGVLVVAGPPAALAAALAAATAHRRLAARRAGRRRAARSAALADAAEVLVAELRTGAHPAHACAVAAAEVDGTVHHVLTEAAARARLGGSVADGLRSGDETLDAELDRLAAAWRVSEQRGVALAELLDAVRSDLTGRTRFARRTEAGLAGARATATVLAGLPLLGIAMGQAIGARPLQLLLTSTVGGVLLLVGTALVCAGLGWTGRITARVGTP